jgi:hypothetical protein
MMAGKSDNLPPEVVRRKILVPGGAFRKIHEFRSEGEKSRLFFVLNQYPEQARIILLATASTKVEKLKNKWPPEVLVEIGKYEYEELDYNSIINCETARAYQKTCVERWISNKEIEPIRPLPSHIMEKLQKSIAKCKVLAPVDKELVLGEEDIIE